MACARGRGAAVSTSAVSAPAPQALALARPTASVAAGLAVIGGSTALVGILDGWVALAWVAAAAAVAAVAGMGLRALRAPLVLVVAGQIAAVACLLTAGFTDKGLLGVLPGPDAAAALGDVLGQAGQQIGGGLPPVPATPELMMLVTLAFGLVAVLVDLLVVGQRAPAAGGLVLLCVVAIPAALADTILPAWTLAAGAAGFGLLLALRQRGRLTGGETGAAPTSRPWIAAPLAVGVTAVAVLLALVIGSLATPIGTAGRIPTGSGGGGVDGQFGVNPFTSLRGKLQRDNNVELFEIRGLESPSYLRALTLSQYVPQRGWQAARRDRGVPLTEQLAAPKPTPPGEPVNIEITNLGYEDSWLPLYGVPLGVRGVTPLRWRYDPNAGTAYTDRPEQEDAWVQSAVLPQPDLAALRAAPRPTGLDSSYTSTNGIDRRVSDLAAEVSGGAKTAFDKTVAISNYFTDPANGFRYSLETAPGNSGDLLVDFLTRGKAGYCEQFASAMAVMLRTVGVPARVAVGFTAGETVDGTRLIRSADAHAWVEAYFAGVGWLTFDPTPLADGRGVVPPYLAAALQELNGGSAAQPELAPDEELPGASAAPEPAATPAEQAAQEAADATADSAVPVWLIWLGLALLAGVGLAAAPALWRLRSRARRLAAVSAGGPAGAVAAWQELVAESIDRGVPIAPSATVRVAAGRLARAHHLDDPARRALRRVVAAVEASWYGGRDDPDGGLAGAVDEVRAGLVRCAQLSLRGRLLPRSVLNVLRPGRVAPVEPSWSSTERPVEEPTDEPGLAPAEELAKR